MRTPTEKLCAPTIPITANKRKRAGSIIVRVQLKRQIPSPQPGPKSSGFRPFAAQNKVSIFKSPLVGWEFDPDSYRDRKPNGTRRPNVISNAPRQPKETISKIQNSRQNRPDIKSHIVFAH
jgi:hypothetical protein